jgi:putative FmdB family regulatory protein
MPIYEFFCNDCNTIFSFLSRSVDTTTAPACPKCHKPNLSRRLSLFATTGRAKEKNNDQPGDAGAGPGEVPFDESKMEKAMTTLAGEAERIDENNPRAAADLMRRLSDMTGLKYGDKMQEAISRMEAGEDPESIEAELGGALENEDPFVMPDAGEGSKTGVRKKAPTRDETLYEM